MFVIQAAQTKLLGVALVLIVALAATIRIQSVQLERQQERTTAIALQASNLEAERDSTRNVALSNQNVASLLGDSLRLVEKQVVQATQTADALDRAMNQERKARYLLSVAIDSLHSVITSEPKDMAQANDLTSTDVRQASFSVRKDPFTVSAQVQIPRPPGSPSMNVAVSVEPIDLEARVTCGAPDGNGIRRASLTASSPAWASVRFNRIEQDPGVCASVPVASSRRRWRFELRPTIGLGLAFSPRNGRVLGGLVLGWSIVKKG